MTIQLRAEDAFARKDLSALVAAADEMRRENFVNPATSRVFTLLGELHRKSGRTAEAIEAYRVAHDPPARRSTGALYGLAECYASLKDVPSFESRVGEYLAAGKTDANLSSRLILAAATLGLAPTVDRLSALNIAGGTLDARYWLRRATAAFRLGRAEQMQDFAARSRAAAAADDAQVRLELAELEYDPDKYWDLRYNSDGGERAPVPPSWRGDIAYAERTARELAYLRTTFDKAFGPTLRFVNGADCGCGSGRMTQFLKERVDNLDCYDISDTALAFARANTKGLKGLSFRNADLTRDSLPSQNYDLLFDFVVVQHQSDEERWRAAIANYVQSLRPGGYIFMVEQRGDDGPNKVPHVRNASADTYRNELISNGSLIVFEELTPWNEICLVGRRN